MAISVTELTAAHRAAATSPDVADADALASADRAQLEQIAQEACARAERAERAEREATRDAEAQREILGVVAHDLRTPLQAISFSARVMFQRGGLAEHQAVMLGRIASSVERMQSIIRDVIDFSRLRSSGALALEVAPTRMRSICVRVIGEAQAAFADREVELTVLGDDAGVWDAGRLEQVVSNLVVNALQHSPRAAKVKVEVGSEGELLQLVVHNEGPPIHPEVLPHLFEPFRRGPSSGGTGLGLFIVREVVKAHGGTVSVRSADGEGTTFTVRLPRSNG